MWYTCLYFSKGCVILSLHKSNKRSLILEKNSSNPSTISFDERTEVFSISCTCGYIGSGLFSRDEEKPKQATSTTVFPSFAFQNTSNPFTVAEENPTAKETCIATSAICPCCGKIPNHDISSRSNPHDFVDFTKIWDNNEKTSFHICFSSYFYNKKNGHLIVKKRRFALSFNATNGNMYFVRDRSVINWSYCAINDKIFKDFIILQRFLCKPLTRAAFVEFLDICYQKRGIEYFDHHKILKRNFLFVDNLRSLFIPLRFKVLQDLPFKELLSNCSIPKKVRKDLAVVPNIDVGMRLIFNLKNKKIAKLFKDYHFNPCIHIFSSLLEEEGAINYFCDLYREQFPNSSKKGMDLQLYDYSERTTINKNNTCFFETDSFDLNTPVSYSNLLYALSFFKKHFKTEHAFLRKIFFSKRKVLDGEKVTIHPNELFSIILDSYKMMLDVKEFFPDSVFVFNLDFIHFHDILSKTYSRIQRANEYITYSEEELSFFNTSVGDLDFHLVQSLDELTDFGTKMNICVPSYASQILNKEIHILFVYRNDSPVVCIEINRVKDDFFITQAKAHSNFLPTSELMHSLLDYFDERGLSYLNCHDVSPFLSNHQREKKALNADFDSLPTIAERDLNNREQLSFNKIKEELAAEDMLIHL